MTQERGLEIEGLQYVTARGTVEVLAIERLAIAPGKVIALIGPNGAGKTTLLRALAGEIHVRGDVSLNGHQLIRGGAYHPGAVRVFHVGQDPAQNVFTDLTIEENLLLGANHRMDPGQARDAALAAWKSHMPAFEMKDRRLGQQLSGGEKQALGLLLALGHAPDVLLLDEHTASLDEKNKQACAELVHERLRSDSRVILWVTQDLALALKYADAYVVLRTPTVVSGVSPLSMDGETFHSLLEQCFPRSV